jgi:hypothetical protein
MEWNLIRVLWFNEGTLSPLPGLEKQSRIALFPTAVAVGHILSALPGLRGRARTSRATRVIRRQANGWLQCTGNSRMMDS